MLGIVTGIVLILVGGIIFYINIPYSPVVSEYKKECCELTSYTNNGYGIMSDKDIEVLPNAMKKYIINNGYIGTKRLNSMQIEFKDAKFILNKGDSPININYSQINMAYEPIRIALIDTSMYGIPFQGIDKFINGTGLMKGVLGKHIKLFEEKGENFDSSSMLTYLAESILMPSVLIQKDFEFEEIDNYNVKVTLNYYGKKVSGIFTFNDSWEIISFNTNERSLITTDGEVSQIPWEVKYINYKKDSANKRPSKVQIIWHYENESSIYFDGEIESIKYK